MNTTPPAPTFRVAQFDRFADIKSFSQEASTLGLEPGQLPMGRLFDGAADIGLRLHAASEISSWQLAGEDKSGDDVAGWRFKPTDACIVLYPHLADWTVLVVND